MTNSQYRALLDLFNEWPEEFNRLSDATTKAFYDRLFNRV